jgi:polyisoprenoid-binding protein YceI
MLFGKKLFGLTATLLLAVFVFSPPTMIIQDDEASIRLQLVSEGILGTIGGLQTTVAFDSENLDESYINATLEVKTLSTGNLVRDVKLGSRKYLHRKKYPAISFKSKQIKDVYNGYLVIGELTIKEETKDVVFDVAFRDGTIIGAASINLMDFGVQMAEKRFENKLDVYIEFPVLNSQ